MLKSTFLFIALSLTLAFTANAQQQKKHAEEGRGGSFKNADVDRFHDVLHPLQHEALPANDFKTIRAQAPNLARVGRALTRMKTPAGVEDKAAFVKHQKSFTAALRRYQQTAARGSDAKLKTAYLAVHDTFEEMAHLLPR